MTSRTVLTRVASAVAAVAAAVTLAAGCSGSDRDTLTSINPSVSSETSSSTQSTGSTPASADHTGSGAQSPGSSTAEKAAAGAELVKSVCEERASVTDLGTIKSDLIDEASGLVASRKNPGVWWTHNDSGGAPELYAFDAKGRFLAILWLDDAKNRDWEDVAIETGPDGKEWVYVGDIGDNRQRRPYVTVYRVETPDLTEVIATESPDGGAPKRFRARATSYQFTYPDGPRDAESLIVDPSDQSVYVIDKDWSLSGKASLYRAAIGELAPGSRSALTKAADLSFPAGSLITAADLSADGTALGVRAYGSEYLFERKPGQSIAEAFANRRCTGPRVPEIQGEGMAFSADSQSYVTIAEGSDPTPHRVTAD